MSAASDQDTAKRRHICIVAAPSGGDMVFGREDIVGGIEVRPAMIAAPKRGPGMRSVGAGEFRFSGRGKGFEISTDIACRQAERTQAGDHQLGEILTDSASDRKKLLNGSHHGGCLLLEFEVRIDALTEVESAGEDRPRSREYRACIVSQVGAAWRQRRAEDELSRFQRSVGHVEAE